MVRYSSLLLRQYVLYLKEPVLLPLPLPPRMFFKNLQLGVKRKKWLATSLQYSVTF